jgi:hypothetical protein
MTKQSGRSNRYLVASWTLRTLAAVGLRFLTCTSKPTLPMPLCCLAYWFDPDQTPFESRLDMKEPPDTRPGAL